MSFTPINDTDFNGYGARSLPNQPTISAEALKAKFDEPARTVMANSVNRLITELQDGTAAASIGAVAPTGRTVATPTVQSVMNKLSTDLGTVESSISTVVAEAHTHTNKASVLDKLDVDSSGKLTFDGSGVGETDYESLSNLPKINSHELKGNQSASDLGLMPATTLATVATSGDYTDLSNTPSLATVATSGSYTDLSNKPTIPDELSDLTEDTGHRTVSDTEKSTWNGKSVVAWSQSITTGQKIATVTIDGTPTDVYAPTGGGGGGGGAVDSVNSQTGTVQLDLGDMMDATFTSLAQNDAVVRNGSNKWVNVPLPAVALSGSYSDLTGKPSIPTVTDTYSGTSSDGMSGKAVKSAIDALDVSDSAVSGQYVSAVSETDGKISVSRASLPSVPDELKDLTGDVNISSPTNDQVLKYDGTSSKWVNGAAPAGGHTMVANTPEADMIDEIANAISSNQKVVSAYGIQKWSNCEAKNILVPVSQGDTGVGVWNDNWESEVTPDRTGWIWHKELYQVLEDGNGNPVTDIKVDQVFLANGKETVSLLGMRIDDDYTLNGQHGGCVAFKFNGAIQETGSKVGVQLTHLRTETYTGTIIT